MIIGKKTIACIAVLFLIVTAYAASVETETTAPADMSDAAVAAKLAQMEFPQVGEVTGDDVNIRSGPGTSYYRCGKLNAGDKITVVDVMYNKTWAKIVPTEGCYSWISKTYVELNPADPKVGVLTGDDVRVWAGSDFVEPLYSQSQQTKLYKGDLVELAGPADLDTDYYKIKPPADAYLWLNMEYVKLLGPVAAVQKPIEAPVKPQEAEKPQPQPEKPTAPPVTKPTPAVTTPPAVPPTEPTKPEVKPEPAKTSVETVALQKCYQAAEDVEKELKKPLPEQNYTPIKQTVTKLLETPDIGKAETYAKALLNQINSYELASQVQKQLVQQDQALDELREKINRAHEIQREKAVPPEAKYLFVGTLKPSHVYTGRVGPKRYLVIDKEKRIICYLLPKGPSQQAKLEGLIDKIVGIRGTVLDDPRAMVPVVLLTDLEPIFED